MFLYNIANSSYKKVKSLLGYKVRTAKEKEEDEKKKLHDEKVKKAIDDIHKLECQIKELNEKVDFETQKKEITEKEIKELLQANKKQSAALALKRVKTSETEIKNLLGLIMNFENQINILKSSLNNLQAKVVMSSVNKNMKEMDIDKINEGLTRNLDDIRENSEKNDEIGGILREGLEDADDELNKYIAENQMNQISELPKPSKNAEKKQDQPNLREKDLDNILFN